MVPGNQDFNYGIDHLQALARQYSNFALITANIQRPDSGYLFEPYRIFERNGLKIGVVGLVGMELFNQIIGDQRRDLPIAA